MIGRFAIDFVAVRSADGGWEPYAIELNLRKGGTTHPFLTLQFLTDGAYDPETALFTAPSGKQKFFVASDHVESPAYRALTADDLFDLAVRTGLHFDQSRQTGVVFHMMSALGEWGRTGLDGRGGEPRAGVRALRARGRDAGRGSAGRASRAPPARLVPGPSRTPRRWRRAAPSWPRRRGRPRHPPRRTPLGCSPREQAASYSAVRSVSNIGGSSVEREQRTPAATSSGRGCSASEGTTATRTFDTGQTSSTVPRSLSSWTRSGVLDGADAVAQPVGLEEMDSVPDRVRRAQLAGVRHGAEAAVARAPEDVLVEMRRILELERAETDTDDASVAVADGVAQAVVHLFRRGVPREIRSEPHLEAVRLARLLDAVAEALVDRLPRHAAAHELQRREDAFDIDGAVLHRLAGVVDGDPPEVVGSAQARRHHQPHVDEVGEIREAELVGEPFGRRRGERDVVALRDREQRFRAQRALEVDVQLDLRIGHE